jgi:hypothetical protein
MTVCRDLMEQFRCGRDVCEDDPATCVCGGDECWRCAGAQALNPPPWDRAPRVVEPVGERLRGPTGPWKCQAPNCIGHRHRFAAAYDPDCSPTPVVGPERKETT